MKRRSRPSRAAIYTEALQRFGWQITRIIDSPENGKPCLLIWARKQNHCMEIQDLWSYDADAYFSYVAVDGRELLSLYDGDRIDERTIVSKIEDES